MKVLEITNKSFKAQSIKINHAENKQVKNLVNKVMAATSVHGPCRSGSVVYKLGADTEISISEPAKNLPQYLEKLGIKFNV